MIRINLFVTVTTMFAGIAMLVPSLFGMNLTSGLEEASGVFVRVTTITSGLMVCCAVLAYRFLSVYAR